MKAEELKHLMIGNWLYDAARGMHLQVHGIDMYMEEIKCLVPAADNDVWEYGFSADDERLEPIPLTPEILEKAAMHTVHRSYFFEFPEVKRTVAVTWYDDTQKQVFLNANYIGILHLQYLHQLQNIVHALTGFELTINL